MIGMTDRIAFQTNILALNAAVEALITASTEQSAEVAQVAQSVAELDRATRQNAALPEQSAAAAAESLKGQGQRLVRVMTFFRVAT